MPAKNILTGRVFGRLTVISESHKDKHGKFIWRCMCSCGVEVKVSGSTMLRGHTKSCGCLKIKKEMESAKKSHGMSTGDDRHELYGVWSSMKKRCNCVTEKSYVNYGGRGIKICKEWYDFTKFLSDMGDRPSPNHSIDRINNDGNYEKSNCRWATAKEQNRNTRKTKLNEEKIKFIRNSNEKGVDLAKKFGVSTTEIYSIKSKKIWKDI